MTLGRLEIRTAILKAALYIYSEFSGQWKRAIEGRSPLKYILMCTQIHYYKCATLAVIGKQGQTYSKKVYTLQQVNLDNNYLLTEQCKKNHFNLTVVSTLELSLILDSVLIKRVFMVLVRCVI